MGNSQTTDFSPSGSSISSVSIKKIIKERKHRKESQKYDDFFVNHHRMYSISHQIDRSNLNPKRIVFISIYGLFRTWKQCPSISLYNAIIIVPLKKEWIESPEKYKHPYNHLLKDKEFLTLLKWKKYQQLALFLLDNSNNDENMNDINNNNNKKDDEYCLIAPVWRRLSLRLQQLHDPLGQNKNGKYNPLIFNEKYWHFQSQCSLDINDKIERSLNNEYSINAEDVLMELYTVTMRYKTIKQILIESNPTLHVITNYINKSSQRKSSENANLSIMTLPNTSSLTITPTTSTSTSPISPISPISALSTSTSNLFLTPQKLDVDENKINGSQSQQQQQQVQQYVEEDIISLDSTWWIADDYLDDIGEDTVALHQFYSFLQEPSKE